jgi:Thioredoxin
MIKYMSIILMIALFAAFSLAPACGLEKPGQNAEPDAPASSKKLQNGDEAKAEAPDKAHLELFAMSQCPFGTRAESVIARVLEALNEHTHLSLRFIVDEVGGPHRFDSLHGAPEVELNRVQACAGIVDSAKQLAFIVASNEGGGDWKTAARKMQLDVEAIQACIKNGQGDDVLSEDAKRCKKMNVNASPTLFINDKEFKGPIATLDIFEAVCAHLSHKAPPECREAPPDFSRGDNSAGAGACAPDSEQPAVDPSMVDETPIDHTVIEAAGAFSDNIEEVMAQTARIYPGAKVERLSSDSEKAKKLIAKYELEWLPAYIFPKSIEKMKNFERFRQIMAPLGDDALAYQLDPMRLGCNYSLKRPVKNKSIDIFYTPFSYKALTILVDILDVLHDGGGKNLQISLRPVGVIAAGDQVSGQYGGPPEVEEMERHIGIYKSTPDKFQAYLRARIENLASSYWEDYCLAAGLDPARVKKDARSERTKKKLLADSKLYFELNATPEIAFLLNNVEIARVKDIEDFKRLLDHMSK